MDLAFQEVEPKEWMRLVLTWVVGRWKRTWAVVETSVQNLRPPPGYSYWKGEEQDTYFRIEQNDPRSGELAYFAALLGTFESYQLHKSDIECLC